MTTSFGLLCVFCVFCERLSICVNALVLFLVSKVGMWDLIVLFLLLMIEVIDNFRNLSIHFLFT